MENTTYSVISLQQLTKDYIPIFKQHFPDCTIGRKFAKYKNRILCFNDNYVFGTDYVGNINKFIISEYHKSLFKNLNYLYDVKNNIIEEYWFYIFESHTTIDELYINVMDYIDYYFTNNRCDKFEIVRSLRIYELEKPVYDCIEYLLGHRRVQYNTETHKYEAIELSLSEIENIIYKYRNDKYIFKKEFLNAFFTYYISRCVIKINVKEMLEFVEYLEFYFI